MRELIAVIKIENDWGKYINLFSFGFAVYWDDKNIIRWWIWIDIDDFYPNS